MSGWEASSGTKQFENFWKLGTNIYVQSSTRHICFTSEIPQLSVLYGATFPQDLLLLPSTFSFIPIQPSGPMQFNIHHFEKFYYILLPWMNQLPLVLRFNQLSLTTSFFSDDTNVLLSHFFLSLADGNISWSTLRRPLHILSLYSALLAFFFTSLVMSYSPPPSRAIIL